ncbi:MAG TPA: glycosyltransferase family A protein [Gemmataceae bacterium]|nr:glycosyltransferase family A protein [Gemmataceae bacterium]
MPSPRFSVVIPTRERAHTLRSTLQTCLEQDFEDYEIVVCDNHSSPATRAVVEEFESPRILYVRAPEPLAMSVNWELAVAHASGEYVTVLGDDDALLSHALPALDGLIRRSGARAIRWSAAFYLWPTIALEGEGNYLALPLGRQLRTADASATIAAVIDFLEPYTSLPMIYNAIIHRDLIADLRNRTGRVFANNCPDVYTGFAFAYLAGTYLSTEVPMSVAGLSGNSTGVATLLLRRPSAIAQEFRRLNARAGLPLHPWVPDLPIFPGVPVADSFQYAKEALFRSDDRLRLDRKRLASYLVGHLWAANPSEWRTRLGMIRASFADNPELQQWFDEHLVRAPFRETPLMRLQAPAMGYLNGQLHLRTDTFGVTDVAGAARLCENLLGFRGTEIQYETAPAPGPHPEFPWLAAEIARSQARVTALEADRAVTLTEIGSLRAQLAAERNTLVRRLRRAPGEFLRLLGFGKRSVASPAR